MMLISVLGTVLTASVAIVPVGAGPCTKGKHPVPVSSKNSTAPLSPSSQPPTLPADVAVETSKSPAVKDTVPAVEGQDSTPKCPECAKKLGESGEQPSSIGESAGPGAGKQKARKPCSKHPAKTPGPRPEGSGGDEQPVLGGTQSTPPGSDPGPGSVTGAAEQGRPPVPKPKCSKKGASRKLPADKPKKKPCPKKGAQEPKPPIGQGDEVGIASNPVEAPAASEGEADPTFTSRMGGDEAAPEKADPKPVNPEPDSPEPKPDSEPGIPKSNTDSEPGSPKSKPGSEPGSPKSKPDSGSVDPKPTSPKSTVGGSFGPLGEEFNGKPGNVSVTPHAQYSSSAGVLGCKIDINHVAYWPGMPKCNDICLKLTYGSRHTYLLRIDSSGSGDTADNGGTHDISYSAWHELTGLKAGGGVPMTYEWADMSECSHLLPTGKMPIAAVNGQNYLQGCLSKDGGQNWLSQNYELFNYADPRCENGPGDRCKLNGQLPECESSKAGDLGAGPVVKDIPYMSLEDEPWAVTV